MGSGAVPELNELPGTTAGFWPLCLARCQTSLGVEQDLVFATSTPLTIAIPGVYSAKRAKVAMVLEVRDLWPELQSRLVYFDRPLVGVPHVNSRDGRIGTRDT